MTFTIDIPEFLQASLWEIVLYKNNSMAFFLTQFSTPQFSTLVEVKTIHLFSQTILEKISSLFWFVNRKK